MEAVAGSAEPGTTPAQQPAMQQQVSQRLGEAFTHVQGEPLQDLLRPERLVDVPHLQPQLRGGVGRQMLDQLRPLEESRQLVAGVPAPGFTLGLLIAGILLIALFRE